MFKPIYEKRKKNIFENTSARFNLAPNRRLCCSNSNHVRKYAYNKTLNTNGKNASPSNRTYVRTQSSRHSGMSLKVDVRNILKTHW